MTPLARQFAEQLILPVKDRLPNWKDTSFLRESLEDTHFFECTLVEPLIWILHEQLVAKFDTELFRNLMFLPAPKTWIEYHCPYDGRMGFLCQTHPSGKMAIITAWKGDPEWSYFILGVIHFHDCTFLTRDNFLQDLKDKGEDVSQNIEKPWPFGELAVPREEAINTLLRRLMLFVLLINTPRIIGRRQFMPHRAFEKRMIAAKPMIGSFPLHAWTELKLEVSRPPEFDGEIHEDHLTGKKALHFVRKHLRIRRGNLEWVRAHWRGDAALGIKQTRYAVVP
jgi:hypothetical protein